MPAASAQYVSQIVTLTILLTLGVYHLLVFLGRRNHAEESRHLYMALFCGGILGFVLVNSYLYTDLAGQGITAWNPILEVIFVLILFRSFLGLARGMLDLPSEILRLLRVMNWILLIPLLLTLTILVMGYHWYISRFFVLNIGITGLCFGSAFLLLLGHAVRKRILFRGDVWPVLVGIVVIVTYLAVSKILVSLGLLYYSTGAHLVVGLAALGFAYALTVRFNGEFAALKNLQDSLEDEVARRTRELQLANEEIRDLGRQKTAFFLNISHEIRTPLTLLANYLALYREKNQGEELEVMQSAVDKMIADVVNFMDAEKIISGSHIYLHDTPCRPSALLGDLMPLFRSYGDKRKITLTDNCPAGLWVLFDPQAFDRVLRNLLMNALKYAGPGASVTVRGEASGERVIIRVKDTGPGIPAEKLTEVQKPFVQLSGSKENAQGMGLGLFIVRSLMAEGSGNLELHSALGQGTEAVLTFRRADGPGKDFPSQISSPETSEPTLRETPAEAPVPRHPASLEEPISQAVKSISSRDAAVLVVEDNIELRTLLARKLGEDFQVWEAADGREGLQVLVRKGSIRCIISDIMMDGMDGMEFFQKVREQPEWMDIPFLFLTARTDVEDRLTAIRGGALDFIPKPFDAEVLRLRVLALTAHDLEVRRQAILRAVEALHQTVAAPSFPRKTETKDTPALLARYGLTDREAQIITLIRTGLEYKEIGARLDISPRTVVRHVQNVFEKTGVHNKIELLNLFY